jgi:hypothetical protein
MEKAARTDVLLFFTDEAAFWANLLLHFLFPNRKGPLVVHLYEPRTFALFRKSVSPSTVLLTRTLWESVAGDEQKAKRDGKITTMREQELQGDKPSFLLATRAYSCEVFQLLLFSFLNDSLPGTLPGELNLERTILKPLLTIPCAILWRVQVR